MSELRAPFPYFGAKSQVANVIWNALGANVTNYCEPFAGSCAVLLGRPGGAGKIETINDADGLLANAWRAMQADPEGVAEAADWPVNECLPAGTMIATPSGPLLVEAVRPGMLVYGMRGGVRCETQVTAVKRSEADELYAVGQTRMTGNHPVWTHELGYVEARSLSPGLHVGVLSREGDKIDLAVLQSSDEKSTLGNLLAVRPPHRGGEVRRNDFSRKGPVSGAPIPCGARGQDAPGLLDSFAGSGRAAAGIRDARDGGGRGVVGSRTILDRASRGGAHEPHEWRGRDAGVRSDIGTAAQVVRDASGRALCPRPPLGHAGADAFTGIRREDPEGERGPGDARGSEGQNISGAEGGTVIRGASGEVIRRQGGAGPYRGAQTENRGGYDGEEASHMRRDGARVRLDHCGGEGAWGQRGVDLPSAPQGLPMQRQSLSARVAVFNFQTDAGNYFADGLLVHNCDLHARHSWLVGNRRDITARLMGSPEWFDPVAAGWWIWGACIWIGSGWCSGEGPWTVVDGELVRQAPGGVLRKMPHVGDGGKGINRQMPHVGNGGTGRHRGQFISEWFNRLAVRLRNVRVVCGDFERVLGTSVTTRRGLTGVFLDPPYDAGNSDPYAGSGSGVARRALDWCIMNGHDPALRIVLAGYEGEHSALELLGWRCVPWKARGGYGSQGAGRGRENAGRERLWISPGCL